MARITRTTRTSRFMVLGLLVPGCTQLEKLDGDSGGNAGIPTEVQRAFDESCAIGNCHDAATRQGGLDLSATGAPSIIGGASSQSDLPLVELGNVQGSYLALKMLPSPPSGSTMPVGVPPDADNPTNVAIILGWIAGATLPGGATAGDSTSDTPAESTSDTTPAETTTGSDVKLCGLADVAPAVPNPFDIGMNAGQIPPDIGAVLSNNCGCHEVDAADLIMGAFPYAGAVHFSTIAEIHSDYMGTLVSARMLERVQSEMPNRMPPPYYCDLGDGSVITEADRQLLIDWLTAEAPDASSWMP